MSYLTGIRHKLISDNECIIIAEKQRKMKLNEIK